MPAFDYSQTSLKALLLIKRFGQTVTVERDNSTYSPATGAVADGAAIELAVAYEATIETFDYSKVATSAKALIEKFGQVVTVERDEGTYQPSTGEIDDNVIRVTETEIDVTETETDVFGNPL